LLITSDPLILPSPSAGRFECGPIGRPQAPNELRLAVASQLGPMVRIFPTNPVTSRDQQQPLFLRSYNVTHILEMLLLQKLTIT
jgi:hypothetical protein